MGLDHKAQNETHISGGARFEYTQIKNYDLGGI